MDTKVQRLMGALADLWSFLTTGGNWTGSNGIISLTRAHVSLSAVALLISTAVALAPAVILAHQRRGALLATSVVNIGRAVPSFALIALVLPFSLRWGFGLGFWPTGVALVALGIPPIFTNTYTAITQVPAATIEAARGVGMTERQLIRHVELPVALPLIITGIRISAVQIVATATLGALVGYQCLGSLIVKGLALGSSGSGAELLVGGAFLVAVLSVLTEVAFTYLERLVTPWRRNTRRPVRAPAVAG